VQHDQQTRESKEKFLSPEPRGDLFHPMASTPPIVPSQASSSHLEKDDESGEESSSDEGKKMPLFTRRDMPEESEDPDTHELLMALWEQRKQASADLVQAMDEDDTEAFEELESQIRHLNRQMIRVKAHYIKKRKLKVATDAYLAKSAVKFTSVDDLPSGKKTPNNLKRSFKQNDPDDFRIVLTYQGNQVYRKAHPRTLTRVIHHVAQQYLREVFDIRVENLSSLLLLHKGEILSHQGMLEDVPVADGDEIMVINLLDEGHNEQDQHRSNLGSRNHSSPDNFDGDHSDQFDDRNHSPRRPSGNNGENFAPRGDHAGRQWEESHTLQSVRAPSQPGNNGGAVTSWDDNAGRQWGESHSLQSARAPSQPGNNGGAVTSRGDHAGRRWEESHTLQSARAPSQPGNNGGAITFDEKRNSPMALLYDNRRSSLSQDHGNGSRSFDKIRQSFKCPRFSGQTKEWKNWNKGFMRYLSIWELEHVVQPDFLDVTPLTSAKIRDNKMVYFILEDAVQSSPLAASYVRQAPLNNGFEAYYTLHDGFVFAGTTTATLLLNDLSNFRFLPDETPTALCLRLEELFEELELLPGNAAVTFVDTQRIGYLLNALRHEKEWDTVSSSITSSHIKGEITFRDACNELRYRCEAARAHDIMDKAVTGRKKIRGLAGKTQGTDEAEPDTIEKMYTLLSTMAKRQNVPGDKKTPSGDEKATDGDKLGRRKFVSQPCLADSCTEETRFSLCGLHYHSLISAKITTLKLRNGYGDATYDGTTNLIVYPPRTPTDRLPTNSPRKVKAGLAGTSN
jgi:hypothetical protein